MSVSRSNIDVIKHCVADVRKIRNVCILAHVDHGKTTIADSLLATNGLLSKRFAGQIRYLDDRRDEQERGITMKSSAVSLYYSLSDTGQKDFVLNLIDTPGHIDFSTEVAAAVRICDGALIIVDLVEGVCVQTRDAIKQAYEEHAKMILILNKIDRLIVELHKSIEDIFKIILRIIEDCNATIAELCLYDIEREEGEEEAILFSPDKGNVIFASALDGWGVTTRLIAELFNDMITGETVDSLNSKLWNFDYYVDSTTKTIKSGAIEKKKENLFIQLCLKTIYYVYFTFVMRMDRDKLNVVLTKLKIMNATREMNHNDPRVQVKAILQTWSPLAGIIMSQCYDIIPSPCEINEYRLQHLIGNYYYENEDLNQCALKMISNFKDLNSPDTVVYVSKMFSVHKKNLSQNKPKIFVPARRIRDVNTAHQPPPKNEQTKKDEPAHNDKSEDNEKAPDDLEIKSENDIIALARVFCGILKKGQELYFLDSSHEPSVENAEETKKIVINELYMLLGRELVLVDSVPYGNICGIGGLENIIMRTGTLSSTLHCLPLKDGSYMKPIVRNTIEPVNPKYLPTLRQGLKYLMQSDSCVQIVMQETGEHVLVTAGDVHLAKCLEDLTTKFIDFEINVSKPMVSLRETIINPIKKFDGVNSVEIKIPDLGFVLKVVLVSVPSKISKFIENNFDILRVIEERQQNVDQNQVMGSVSIEKTFQNEHVRNMINKLQSQMKTVFNSCEGIWSEVWCNIWSIGKMRDCVNLLINHTNNYKANIFTMLDHGDPRSYFDHCIVNGFKMCCQAGPICEEPLLNCAFFITDYYVQNTAENKSNIAINIPVTVRNGFREAFDKQSQRLVEPIFTTDIQVNTSILGKVYSVINKRHGKVLDAVGMDEQEKIFLVKAQIPVIESDGFANEIRKTTSGQANPNLRFSHYEVVDGDPYYEPESDDEDDDSNNADTVIRASKLVKEVRRRKGLLVDDQIVVHAEKQRTLNKKK